MASTTSRKIELVGLLRHTRMEHDLEQQIAQLIPQAQQVVTVDGVRHLVGFLDGIRGYAAEVLGEVPGATRARGPQCGHDIKQFRDISHNLLFNNN